MFENQTVRDESSGAIYRLSGGFKLGYPNPGTYAAHGSPPFTNYNPWFLMNIPSGPNIYPPGVFEDQVVRNPMSGSIYKLINGQKCHYPSMHVYKAHGEPPFTDVNPMLLADIVDGPHMNHHGIMEGAVVRDPSSGSIYVIKHGHKHHYPSMNVYAAHGNPPYVEYDSSILNSIPSGHPILPPGFYDGQVVRDSMSGAIYRIVNGQKRHYPDMQIYEMHGAPAFTNFESYTLNEIPNGPAYYD